MSFKSVLIISCIACTFGIVKATDAFDCDKVPPNITMNMESCCTFPSLGDDASVAKCENQLRTKGFDDNLMQCKVAECVMKELKLLNGQNDLDKAASLKHVDVAITDTEWKPVYRMAVHVCYKEVNEELDNIIKEFEAPPYNIKKDQCNVKFVAFGTCTRLEAFTKCPQSSWTESLQCNTMKMFLDKCGDDVDVISEMSEKKKKIKH